MTAKRILVVEDEKAIRDMIAFGLRRAGFEVREAEDCREARARIADLRPDLMLIDWMLPDMSGLELTRSLKRAKDTEEMPVIMLTARAEEQDKVGGLDGGADDYITKPFSPRELLARIHAVLRRAAPAGAGDIMEAQGLKLDDSSHRVSAGEREIALGPTEYRLLHFFMTHPERVYSREQLLDRVWGGNVYVEERTVDVHIRRLRKALEPFAGSAGADRARRRLSVLDARGLSAAATSRATGTLNHGGDVDVRARAARGHPAVGPVSRPAVRARSGCGCCGFACLYLGWQLLNLYRLDRWLRLRSQLDPPNLGGIWGDIIAPCRAPAPAQAISQAAPGAAVPRAAPLDRGAARRRDHPEHPERDRLVQPQAAGCSACAAGRLRPAHRQSDALRRSSCAICTAAISRCR